MDIKKLPEMVRINNGYELKASEVIKMEYGTSKNFITPNVIDYGILTTRDSLVYAYELSTGEGFNREPIFGVSVVRYNTLTNSTERLTDSSGVYMSKHGAYRHINNLIDRISKGDSIC